jgi:hypothetical protein
VYCGPADEPFVLEPEDDPLNLAREGAEYVAEHGPQVYSYGLAPTERFAEASARGLDFLAITDHNDTRSATDPGFGTNGVLGIPGYENSVEGHAQVVGVDRVLDNGDKSAAAIRRLQAEVRARGGVLQANHPGYDQETPFASCATPGKGLHWKYGYEVAPDTVEVWNPTTLVRTSEAFYDCLLQRGERPALTAGSDSHWAAIAAAQGSGNPTTWVLAAEPTREGVLEALREGRTSTSRSAPAQGGGALLLESDADRDGTWVNAIGEDVPAGAPMRVRSASPTATGYVTVVANGATAVNEATLAPGAAVAFTAPPSGWMRAVLASARRSAADAPGCAPAGQAASTCPYDQALLGMTSAAFVAATNPDRKDDRTAGEPPRDRPAGEAATAGSSSSGAGRQRPRTATRFASKLRIRRARIRNGRLDVLAFITRRASGRVAVTFHAAGRRVRFTRRVDAQRRRVRFTVRLPRAQRRLGTGIVMLTYRGDGDTLPKTVRVRTRR